MARTLDEYDQSRLSKLGVRPDVDEEVLPWYEAGGACQCTNCLVIGDVDRLILGPQVHESRHCCIERSTSDLDVVASGHSGDGLTRPDQGYRDT